MSAAYLRVQNLTKNYGTKAALRGIDLTAYSGEILAVLGKNGAGKTSFINSVLGMHSYQASCMELFGQHYTNQQRPLSIRQRLGVMMQIGALSANLTVAEQLDLFCSYYANGASATELIAQFELHDIAPQRFGRLSGGQRQQVLFALSVAGQPDLLFLDEPTVGMDVEVRHRLWQHIQNYRANGCAIVLTTHYIEEAERLADRVAVLREGQIIASGSVAEVIGNETSLENAYLKLMQENQHA